VRATLWRNAETVFGVFGYLDLFNEDEDFVARFCTAEDDWLHNAPSVSCIPSGSYLCRRGHFPKNGEKFQVMDVPNRSTILIHAGNTEEDVMGCIMLGGRFGSLVVADEDVPDHPKTTKWAVLESQAAIQTFMALLAGVDIFPLTIAWAFDGEWRR
jgi:Family of unknown function (DUF5675)